MSVNVYKWTDADAPVLTSDGPGAMANLLRKCLVDGYGSGTEEKLPAGWSIDWDSTSNAKAAFLPGAPEAQNCHYYVDDTGTVGAGGNKMARIWMIENWAGFDASDNPTGTLIPSDMTWGRSIMKSRYDADATVVPWVMIATDAGFYIGIDWYNKSAMLGNYGPSLGFCGKGIAYGDTDTFLDVLAFSGFENYGSIFPAYLGPIGSPRLWDEGDQTGAAMRARRTYDGGATSSAVGSRCGAGGSDYNNNYMGYEPSITHPDPITGGTLTANALITIGDPTHSDTLIRGHFPGLLWPLHNQPFTPLATEILNGREYFVMPLSVSSKDMGQCLIDVSGPWE